jgi:hypothetical protein
VSDTQAINGWCYLCNTSIDADVQAHFDQEHQARTVKPKEPMLSWQHRTRNVMLELGQLLTESDEPSRQIDIIDGVLKDLYLVRAKLAQLKGTPVKRVKEG